MDPRNHLICWPSLRHLKMLSKANIYANHLDFHKMKPKVRASAAMIIISLEILHGFRSRNVQ